MEYPGSFAPKIWRAIGERIAEARSAAGINRAALALGAHISRQALSKAERGEKGLRIETLYRIARATQRPMAFFVPDDP